VSAHLGVPDIRHRSCPGERLPPHPSRPCADRQQGRRWPSSSSSWVLRMAPCHRLLRVLDPADELVACRGDVPRPASVPEFAISASRRSAGSSYPRHLARACWSRRSRTLLAPGVEGDIENPAQSTPPHGRPLRCRFLRKRHETVATLWLLTRVATPEVPWTQTVGALQSLATRLGVVLP
jgi:hypothetical protein